MIITSTFGAFYLKKKKKIQSLDSIAGYVRDEIFSIPKMCFRSSLALRHTHTHIHRKHTWEDKKPADHAACSSLHCRSATEEAWTPLLRTDSLSLLPSSECPTHSPVWREYWARTSCDTTAVFYRTVFCEVEPSVGSLGAEMQQIIRVLRGEPKLSASRGAMSYIIQN